MGTHYLNHPHIRQAHTPTYTPLSFLTSCPGLTIPTVAAVATVATSKVAAILLNRATARATLLSKATAMANNNRATANNMTRTRTLVLPAIKTALALPSRAAFSTVSRVTTMETTTDPTLRATAATMPTLPTRLG